MAIISDYRNNGPRSGGSNNEVRLMTKQVTRYLIELLESRFPELATDEEMNGGDTVEALCDWYEQLRESLG